MTDWMRTWTTGLAIGALALASPDAPAQQQTPDQQDQPQSQPADVEEDAVREPVRREVRENGLVIEDYVIGEGEPVPPDAVVTMSFTATTDSGFVVADTSQLPEPPTFFLKAMPEGARVGVVGMRPGGERTIIIPPDLGIQSLLRQAGQSPDSHLTMAFKLLDFDVMEIEDVEEGEGDPCPAGTVVVARVEGELADGTPFSTGADEEPVTFPIGAPPPNAQTAIPPAIREGIVGMKRGGVRRVDAPWAIAYGAQGMPPTVPAKTDVIFTIYLEDFFDVEVEDVVEGDGAVCPEGATVTVRYTGTLEDGTVFDTTDGKGAVTFDLDNLIPGWKLGVPGMRVGGTRKIEIPWQLGYGDQGTSRIPPRSNLTFEVELVAFED